MLFLHQDLSKSASLLPRQANVTTRIAPSHLSRKTSRSTEPSTSPPPAPSLPLGLSSSTLKDAPCFSTCLLPLVPLSPPLLLLLLLLLLGRLLVLAAVLLLVLLLPVVFPFSTLPDASLSLSCLPSASFLSFGLSRPAPSLVHPPPLLNVAALDASILCFNSLMRCT